MDDEIMDNEIKKGAKGQGTIEGSTYLYNYNRGSDKHPPSFRIDLECPAEEGFKVTREGGFDRFFKKIGVAVEMTTHDTEFDKQFYISTDYNDFTRAFLYKSKNREMIKQLFDMGFNRLILKGKYLSLYWDNYRPKAPKTLLTTDDVHEAASRLATMKQNIPAPGTFAVTDSGNWKGKRFLVFAVAVFLLISGFVTTLLGMIEYEPLDAGTLFLDSLKISIPAFIVFTWLALQFLKGRSSSHRELTACFFIALFAFPLAGLGYTATLNAVLDDSERVIHESTVIKKYYKKSKNNKDYYLVVDSWRENNETETLDASYRTYNRVVPGKTIAIVETQSGKFDYEWLVNYHIEN